MMFDKKSVAAAFLALTTALGGCGEDEAETADANSDQPDIAYTIDVTARPISHFAVEMTISTNIPTPIEVMAGFSLRDQKPDDVYIGTSQRITLQSSRQTVVIDSSNNEYPLPTGEYMAEVSFYPRWGAKKGNPDAKAVKIEVHGSAPITLEGSGESAADWQARENKQLWVMENVFIGTPWIEADFVRRLGNYTKFKSTMSHLHDAYYFPKADMTIIVNSLKGDVTIWRMGKQAK